MTVVIPKRLDAPPITSRSGELLDVATVHDGLDYLEAADLFESYNCLSTFTQATWPACPPSTLAAPVQSASSTATSGGTLAAGTYRAKITAVNSRGETIGSNEQSQVTTGAVSTITWNWAAVTGATGYRVYVTAVGGATNSEVFLANVTAPTVTYVQTAPVTAGGATPPTSNTANVTTTKTFGGPGWPDGIRFAVYGGVDCKSVGNSLEHEHSELERAFLANESVGVEQAIMAQLFTNPAATDITPAGGAVDPAVGLAILEGYASTHYAGVPTIHAPRTIGGLLWRSQVMVRVGNAFYSTQGSKVASGGGYQNPNNGPTGAAPAAGELWMYASGEVVVARGDLISQVAADQGNNSVIALVERAYVAGVDCFTAAIKVKVA